MRMMERRTHEHPQPDDLSEEREASDAPSVGEEGQAGPLGRSVKWLLRDPLLISVVAGVFLLDQTSKYLVTRNLSPYESWPESGLVRIVHGSNTGTAFGLFPDQTTALIVASVFAIGFLFYFYRTQALPSRLLRLAIGLQLGGAFGNLLDRIDDGAVVDFIDVGWWPVFNVADSSITIGIAILIGAITFGGDNTSEKTAPALEEREGPY